MVHVPAFCDNCYNIFPSGFVFENSMGVTMRGNKSQCPRCRSMARIPDGVFNFYNNGIEVLQATEETIKDLQKFYTIIQQASIAEIPIKEVEKEIHKEVPKLSFLARYLPKNAKELGVYLSAIASLIGGMGGNIEINPTIEINQMEVNHYHYQIEETYNQMAPTLAFELPERKIGRNEPCPCESGLKFKYCHGK